MAQNLQQFVDKKVTLTKNLSEPNADGHTAEEIEGTVLAANELGVLIKPKGKTQPVLVELSAIEGDIHFVAAKPKALAVRWIKDTEFGQARQHLVTAHGFKISDITAMDEEKALEFHAGLDHSDLAHQHGEKPVEVKTEAPADAGA